MADFVRPNEASVRYTTLLALLCYPLLAAPAAPPAVSIEPKQSLVQELRGAVADAEDRASWEAAAWALLDALDRQGKARENETLWLVSHLLETHPDHPALLWRRADTERAIGNAAGALEDLERLIAKHPEHPYAVRARRALAALYIMAERKEDAVRADESLLVDGIADPVAVLTRLARTYDELGRADKVRHTLQRLEKVAPDRLDTNNELFWLRALTEDEFGTPQEASRRFMRFVNLFPRDSRRSEALLRAGRAQLRLGNAPLALKIVGEAVSEAERPDLAAEARMLRGEIFEGLGKSADAREEYKAVLTGALDPEAAALALEHLVKIERDSKGAEGALWMLASLIARGDALSREMARNHFDEIMRALSPELVKDPARAAVFHELTLGIAQRHALSHDAQLAAGQLLEKVGDDARAASIYRGLLHALGPAGKTARRELVTVDPEAKPKKLDPATPARLEALAQRERWDLLIEALGDEAPKTSAATRLGAQARFARGEFAEALALLDKKSLTRVDELTLRGDARAYAGRWKPACNDYRSAHKRAKRAPLAPWLELRVAVCELREGAADKARTRLEALLEKDPAMPVSFAAEDLLARSRTKKGRS